MAGWQDSLNRCHVSYLQNVPGLLGTLDRKAPVFDFPNDFNSKILLQKMVAGYRQSCMAILMDYASQCDGVFCGDSKRKINVKYFLIPAYNKYLSQVCRSASLQVCKSAVCVCRTLVGETVFHLAKNLSLYFENLSVSI